MQPRSLQFPAVLFAAAVVVLSSGCKGGPILAAPAPPVQETRNERRAERRDERRREDPNSPFPGYGGSPRPGENASFPNDASGSRGRNRRGHGSVQSAPGSFDFYLLNLSWSPEFCATHADSAECGRQLGFVVHGLWPQDLDGSYPEQCSNVPAPANLATIADFMPTPALAQHEWQTHGTCSGLSPEGYFADVRNAFHEVHIPSAFGSMRSETMLAPDAILAQFAAANPAFPAESLALSCGNNRLTAIELCLTKDLRPEACQGVRSCRANAVRITAP